MCSGSPQLILSLAATDKIATDLQRQDIYEDTFLNENGFNYLFGAVTCPVVAMVLVAGMFVSIVLGVIAHMVLETLVRRSMKLVSYQDATLRHIPAQKAVPVCRTSQVTKPVRVRLISPVPHNHTVSRGS